MTDRLAGISLLVVDDDDRLRERLARAFRERGFEVVAAKDFDEACALAQMCLPELALVDVRMPGRSGLELICELRSIVPSVKVVVLTGYGSAAIAGEALRLGAAACLQKPIEADEIMAAFSPARIVDTSEGNVEAGTLASDEVVPPNG